MMGTKIIRMSVRNDQNDVQRYRQYKTVIFKHRWKIHSKDEA